MRPRTLYRLSVYGLLAVAAANVYVAVRVYLNSRRQVVYNVTVQPPPVFPTLDVPTNQPPYRSGLLPDTHGPSVQLHADSSLYPITPMSWTHEYQFFVAAGRRMALLNGQYIREGDLHAYGIVRDIWPERIYFEGGSFIENSRRVTTNVRNDITAPSSPAAD